MLEQCLIFSYNPENMLSNVSCSKASSPQCHSVEWWWLLPGMALDLSSEHRQGETFFGLFVVNIFWYPMSQLEAVSSQPWTILMRRISSDANDADDALSSTAPNMQRLVSHEFGYELVDRKINIAAVKKDYHDYRDHTMLPTDVLQFYFMPKSKTALDCCWYLV